jgi:hypothetical protein
MDARNNRQICFSNNLFMDEHIYKSLTLMAGLNILAALKIA